MCSCITIIIIIGIILIIEVSCGVRRLELTDDGVGVTINTFFLSTCRALHIMGMLGFGREPRFLHVKS